MNQDDFLKKLDESLVQLNNYLGKLENQVPFQEREAILQGEKEIMTRKDVAKLFSCDLTTVDNWVKKGKLIKYGLGKKVYFLKKEVFEAMKKL